MLVADVRLGDDLAQLYLTPRIRTTVGELSSLVRAALPGVKPKRQPQGLTVPARVGAHLAEGIPGVDLRWTEEAIRFVDNRRDLAARHQRFREAAGELAALSRRELEERIPTIADIDQLDDHQVLNVATMVHRDCFGMCLFDEQGAGKTVSAIYAWDALSAQDAVDFALVVAPKSMVPEWARDFARFRGDMYSVRIASGTRRSKLAAVRAMPDVLITNFESAITLEHELMAHLRRLDQRALLVVDESFFVKNRDARRTRTLRRLREWTGRAFVLCGTPAPNAATDIIEQFNLADYGATFAEAAVPDDSDEARVAIDETLRKRGVYRRSLKQDVLPELPDKSFDVVHVEMEPQQQRAYDAALSNLLLDLRETTDDEFGRQLTSFMARRTALLQICSNPSRIVEGYQETPAKLHALDQLLDQWVRVRKDKVVVWSSYRASLDALVERYGSLGLVRYDGSVTDVAQRREAVRAFQEDDATRVFVGNPAAAGAGLTLHAARLAIYESFTNQAAHYLQSLDRIHRRGQERPVQYVILLAADSIEQVEYETLRRKERAAQDLLGDPHGAAPTRTTMLHELESLVDAGDAPHV